MSDQIFNPFLVNDNDESLKSKTGGVFGLNTGVHISEFDFKDTDKEGNQNYSVTIGVQIGDRVYRTFLYFNEGDKVYVKGELTSPGEEGYNEVYYAELSQKIAVLKHALKAVGVTQQQLDQVASTLDPTQLIVGIKAFMQLLPADYKSKSVDVFLEYQWSIKQDQKETFLELPKNMKSGYFLIPSVVAIGKWTEVRTPEELSYVDNAGTTHPLKRGEGFLSSPRAEKQTEEGNKNKASVGFNASAANPQNAAKATWK